MTKRVILAIVTSAVILGSSLVANLAFAENRIPANQAAIDAARERVQTERNNANITNKQYKKDNKRLDKQQKRLNKYAIKNGGERQKNKNNHNIKLSKNGAVSGENISEGQSAHITKKNAAIMKKLEKQLNRNTTAKNAQ